MNKMQFLRQIIIIDASPFIRRKEEMHYLVLYVELVRSEKKLHLHIHRTGSLKSIIDFLIYIGARFPKDLSEENSKIVDLVKLWYHKKDNCLYTFFSVQTLSMHVRNINIGMYYIIPQNIHKYNITK